MSRRPGGAPSDTMDGAIGSMTKGGESTPEAPASQTMHLVTQESTKPQRPLRHDSIINDGYDYFVKLIEFPKYYDHGMQCEVITRWRYCVIEGPSVLGWRC